MRQDDLEAGCDLSKVTLIFVAACMSDKIGQMLANQSFGSKGVRHIITSKEKMELDDEYTIKFTEALYNNLLAKRLSIC